MNTIESGLPDTAHRHPGGRRILVIEDESMVGMLVDDFLTDIGCIVVAMASRFEDALEKAKTLDYDAALLDINLNGIQTFPIAEEIRRRGVPVVFVTGYGSAAVPDALRDVPVLRKPFRRTDLERMIGALLA